MHELSIISWWGGVLTKASEPATNLPLRQLLHVGRIVSVTCNLVPIRADKSYSAWRDISTAFHLYAWQQVLRSRRPGGRNSASTRGSYAAEELAGLC